MVEPQGLYGKFDVFRHGKATPLTGCFVLRPEKDPAARAAIRAYAIQTPDDVLRGELIEWMKSVSPSEESELRTVSSCVLWLTWHHAEAFHDWGRHLWTVRVPIFKKPPGYRVEIVRYEVEERENLPDAVYALAKRLGTGSHSFSELVEKNGGEKDDDELVKGEWPR